MTEHDPFQQSLSTLEAMMDGIAEILDGIAEMTPIPSRNETHPALQPVIERVAALEVTVRHQRMQIDAILNALTLTIESNDRLNDVIAEQRQQLSSVSNRFKAELLRQAVSLMTDFGSDDSEPTLEDKWEVDEWKLGEELTYRVEQPS